MSRELTLLARSATFENGVSVDPICRMKIPRSGSSENDPVIGFASTDLGRQFISGFGGNTSFSLLPFRSLTSEQIERLGDETLILFEDQEQITSYTRDRYAFDYAAHVLSIAEALRRVNNAF